MLAAVALMAVSRFLLVARLQALFLVLSPQHFSAAEAADMVAYLLPLRGLTLVMFPSPM